MNKKIEIDDLRVQESVDPFKLPVVFKVDGVHLKVISIAFAAFGTESMIPEAKRNIQNYDVELRQDKEYFFIYFSAHLSAEDRLGLTEGGETSLGKSVMYIVTKNDFKIQKRYFFK